MKSIGCVVEVREKTLVLMTASCDFVEIPKNSTGLMAPGMEVVYETNPRRFAFHKKWMAVAAMFMVLIMGSLLILQPASAMPVYMASIDINPSVNMFIDGTGHVVEIQPMNTEAKNLKTRSLEGETIEEAIASLMTQLFEQGYFADKTDQYIVFSLAAIDASIQEEMVGDMMLRLERTIQDQKQLREIDLEVLSFAAMKPEVEEAESKDVSLNQMLVRNQYQAMMQEKSPNADNQQNDESMEAMVRTILKEKEHPVFEEHPGADPGRNNVKKENVPSQTRDNNVPSQTRDNEEGELTEPQKEHPVFEEHPGNADNGNDRLNGPGSEESQGNNNGQGNR